MNSLSTKYQIFNATTIKYIAAGLMLLDHVHQMFAANGAPLWLTMLGRPVFPMFLFLAADSFFYTSNRIADGICCACWWPVGAQHC